MPKKPKIEKVIKAIDSKKFKKDAKLIRKAAKDPDTLAALVRLSERIRRTNGDIP